MKHSITRQRQEPRRRHLTVKDKASITPGMLRILFEGEDLTDFSSPGADDHVKLFIPAASGEPEKRDYTPRAFDRATRTLAIDFAIHEAGPATRWALAAKTGDALQIGGPRGSTLISPTFDWWLLVGDETALPAIGRRIEELPAGARVTSLIAVAGPAEEQSFRTQARHEAIWVYRPPAHADNPAPLLEALHALAWPEGDGFVWVAAEARVARAVRDYISGCKGHPAAWMKAAGYWLKGEADAHEKFEG